VIVGTQTFGKGSVQTIFPLRDGSGLRLTTARYYTPKGARSRPKGITPDIIVNSLVPKRRRKSLHLKCLQKRTWTGISSISARPLPRRKETRKEEAKDKKNRRINQLDTALDLLKSWSIFKNLPVTGK